MIEESTLDFLQKLSLNNHKEWFTAHKSDYEKAKNNFTFFCAEILEFLKTIDPNLYDTEVKQCIFRINRDLRFSKDKSPYKNYLSAGFGPGGRSSGKIDVYFQLQFDNTMVGAGMWQPSSSNLAKFRQEIDYNPERLKNIIYSEDFKNHFPIIHGEKLKTMPKGYETTHPDIELLKYKELFYIKKFSNQEVLSKDFNLILNQHILRLQSYIDYLNDIFENN